MIKGGTGGGKTRVGLTFEEKVSIEESILKIDNYKIVNDEVFYNNELVAKIFKKHDLYKKLLEPNNIDYKTIISKKLLPDNAIFVLTKTTMFIIEIKFQEVAGSVDEKLQTCDFKRKQYTKLFSPLNIYIDYIYILNDWFKKPEYKDTLDYILSVGCKYFFNELPLEYLGLPFDS